MDKLLFLQDDGKYPAQAICDFQALAVSDGSFKASTGTATSAFLLKRPDWEEHCTTGVNCIPSGFCSLLPFQAKLRGMAGALVVLESLCEQHSITQGGVWIGLDNEGAKSQSELTDPHWVMSLLVTL